MSRVLERQAQLATIRKLPLQPQLVALLEGAAEAAGVDQVLIYSGGQARLGTGGPRTGSTRHDLGYAADLRLLQGGREASFATAEGRALFGAFARECARRGATGIGAGANYMGPQSMHVGYGAKAVWGAGGKAIHAPQWLVSAVSAGWAAPLIPPEARPVLKEGAHGADVARLQRVLHGAGFDPGPDDGDFGPRTERAVLAFQRASKLKADGVVGKLTWVALEGGG